MATPTDTVANAAVRTAPSVICGDLFFWLCRPRRRGHGAADPAQPSHRTFVKRTFICICDGRDGASRAGTPPPAHPPRAWRQDWPQHHRCGRRCFDRWFRCLPQMLPDGVGVEPDHWERSVEPDWFACGEGPPRSLGGAGRHGSGSLLVRPYQQHPVAELLVMGPDVGSEKSAPRPKKVRSVR